MRIERVALVLHDRGGWRLGILYTHATKSLVRVLDAARLRTHTLRRNSLVSRDTDWTPRRLRIRIEKDARKYRRCGVSFAPEAAKAAVVALREMESINGRH